ncbi:MAG: hypothetical protein JSU86_12115 [Phycisphaerales bacterium]|nr:MAG: hypothetical protein JSU86_12115 [Phycisphaerales bacterium]
MIGDPSIFRRAYDTVALFALLNMLALGGLGVYLVASGALDTEKARRIGAVLRGEDLPEAQAQISEEPVAAETDTAGSGSGGDVVAQSQMEMEILRREGERIKAELDQRLALNNSILLRVMTERERFQQERDKVARQQKTALDMRREEGFKKQIAIYESLAPKVAVQHLLAMSEPDDAAKILLEIQTRKAKKIVEAAKRGDQMEKMKAILKRVREVAPDRSAELETNEP